MRFFFDFFFHWFLSLIVFNLKFFHQSSNFLWGSLILTYNLLDLLLLDFFFNFFDLYIFFHDYVHILRNLCFFLLLGLDDHICEMLVWFGILRIHEFCKQLALLFKKLCSVKSLLNVLSRQGFEINTQILEESNEIIFGTLSSNHLLFLSLCSSCHFLRVKFFSFIIVNFWRPLELNELWLL